MHVFPVVSVAMVSVWPRPQHVWLVGDGSEGAGLLSPLPLHTPQEDPALPGTGTTLSLSLSISLSLSSISCLLPSLSSQSTVHMTLPVMPSRYTQTFMTAVVQCMTAVRGVCL